MAVRSETTRQISGPRGRAPAGLYPTACRAELREQAYSIDDVAQGDPTVFLALWDLLVRDVIESDPSIVRNAFWDC